MFRNPTTDLIVVLVIVLLFFGPKRLPALGRDLGAGLREFKDSISGGKRDGDGEEREALGTGATPTDRPAAPGERAPAEPTAPRD